MFNPTNNIKLEREWIKRYRFSRVLLFILFLLFGFYISYRIIFPQENFAFFFRTPNANKNSIINPRNSAEEKFTDGKIEKNENLFFDTSVSGNFSKTSISIKLEDRVKEKLDGTIQAKKGYQAIFYPKGKDLGFEDGSLIFSEGFYYIISKGSRRIFESAEVLEKLGFSKNMFKDVKKDDLMYNPAGELIESSSDHPEDTIFIVSEEYFILRNKMLVPFLSQKAFLTRYEHSQAIESSSEIFNKYPLNNDDFIGFAPGTLIAAGISVFIVDSDGLLPINNPVTFESMGYDWNEVISVTSEEFSLYEKKKLFSISNPHPDGTVFRDINSGEYYEVKKGTLRQIQTSNILSSRLKTQHIDFDSNSYKDSTTCQIKRKNIFLNTYICEMEISEIDDIIGNNYRFEASFNNDINIRKLEANFSQVLDFENMLKSLGLIKNRILNNYIPN